MNPHTRWHTRELETHAERLGAVVKAISESCRLRCEPLAQ